MSRDIITKSNAIQSKMKDNSLDESDMKDVNNIDITLTKGMLYSEKNL